MYFTLTWTPDPGADADEVRDDVLEIVERMPFENPTELKPGCVIANVRHGRGVGDVFDLEMELRDAAAERFTFVLTHASRGELLLHSGELDDDAILEVVDY